MWSESLHHQWSSDLRTDFIFSGTAGTEVCLGYSSEGLGTPLPLTILPLELLMPGCLVGSNPATCESSRGLLSQGCSYSCTNSSIWAKEILVAQKELVKHGCDLLPSTKEILLSTYIPRDKKYILIFIIRGTVLRNIRVQNHQQN